MGKYVLKNDTPIETRRKRKEVLSSVKMDDRVFNKMPIYVVSDAEYKRFLGIDANRKKYMMGKHSFGSGTAGTFFGILLDDPEGMLVSLSALRGRGNRRRKKGSYPAHWASISFESDGKSTKCRITRGEPVTSEAAQKRIAAEQENKEAQKKGGNHEQKTEKITEHSVNPNIKMPNTTKLDTVTICLADIHTYNAIKEYSLKIPNREFVKSNLQLRNKSGHETTVEGLLSKTHEIYVVLIWDFVRNNISTMQHQFKYATISIQKDADIRMLPAYLVIDESQDQVFKLLKICGGKYNQNWKDAILSDETPQVTDKGEQAEQPKTKKVCFVSDEDYQQIERRRLPELGNNFKLTYLPFERKDKTSFSARCLDTGAYVFVNASKIVHDNLSLKDKAYLYHYGVLYYESSNSSALRIRIIQGREKTAALLRDCLTNGNSKQKSTTEKEQNTLVKKEATPAKTESATDKKKPVLANTQPAVDASKLPGYEAGRKVWAANINLSTLDANKTIMLFSRKCHCSKCARRFSQDTIVNCTAFVVTQKGRTVPVTVQYCSGCKSFYMNYEVYAAYIRKYGRLRFNCEIDQSDVGRYSDIGFADDSFLSRAGYSVKASVSQRKRQIVLAELLESGQATKWEITEKITEFIRLRKNNPDMATAVACWEEDIAFVADYDTGKQAKVGQATFRQGGKITRR